MAICKAVNTSLHKKAPSLQSQKIFQIINLFLLIQKGWEMMGLEKCWHNLINRFLLLGKSHYGHPLFPPTLYMMGTAG